MNETQPILEVKALRKVFPSPGGELCVLERVDFRPDRGRMTAIVGASGAGKSTLLHVLGTLERLTEGSVRFEGREIFALPARDLARFRNRSIGFIFQFHHLLPEFDALENVIMPGLMTGRPRSELEVKGLNLLESVGLQDRVRHRPGELSGGEQQRVAVARALVNEPVLLLADEPSGNLDRTTSEELHSLLARLVRDRGQTTVVATHDERLADRADAVYRLEEGRLHPVRTLADNGERADNDGDPGPSEAARISS
jgi:lipoprotein-releasing system ATP-binding protein